VLDRAEIQAGETVLDVGCGDGLIAFGALERVGTDGRVIFSDISQVLLEVSRELAGADARCEFILVGADDLAPIAEESVDVVTTRSVIIYVSDKRAAFGEFFRVLRPGGRLSMFEPINRFSYPEPEGVFMGLDVQEIWPIARRVRERYNQMAGDEAAMIDFDERDLLELARGAGFASVDVEFEARIERGRIWGREPPPLEQLLNTAPNPNAPTFEEVMAAELTAGERERFLAYVKPRYEAREMTGRSAVAYLRARKTGSRAEPEGRVPVDHEDEGIRDDAVRPAKDPEDEVEQAPWIAAGEEDREPGDDHRHKRRQPEERQQYVVRDREQPLHEREPAVEPIFRVWIRVVERD
jgi:arsenite methyltransferase